MPSINPDNYNIDNLDSINLGPISVTDFRTYILNYNLLGVNPQVQSLGYGFYPRGVYIGDLWNPIQNIQDIPDLSTVAFTPSVYNNNTQPRPNNISKNLYTNNSPFYGSPIGQETYELVDKSLTDPGNIDGWVSDSNFYTDVSTIRDMVNLSNNEYGPQYISAYNDNTANTDTTGYKQYPTNANGDVTGPIIAKSLGFSTTGAINFPSELQTIRDERLAIELKNRVELNFVSDTIGSINLDPLGLLSGQQLITPNYTITRPPGFLGKVAEFTANLAGFNIPTSIIPGGNTIQIGSNSFQTDLLDYTGNGQKNSLYANVYSSKYQPEQEDTTNNYLKIPSETQPSDQTLAQKLGTFFNDLISPNSNKSLASNTSTDTNPPDPFVSMGLDGTYPAIEGLDPNSSFNDPELDRPPYLIPGATVEYYPNKTTLKSSLIDTDDSLGSFTHVRPSTEGIFDWRSRNQPIAKRGLLKYTQDMINNAEANGNKGAAKYIGRFNSNSNLIEGQKDVGDGRVINVPRHKDVSMGSLVRSGDDSYYCRSWSSRNPYQNHYDLVRRDKLYRMLNKNFFGNYLSVLEDTGHVKVAPYSTDDFSQASDTNKVTFNPSSEVKRYMLSIENLAWMDAPEKIGLKSCELGPNGGRIMWFPPYDIQFSENTSVSWESTNFIGRGEPIYSYNYTERKGTLSFSIVTDHPSVINEMKKETEDTLYKFFVGCGVDVTKFFETEVPIVNVGNVEKVVEQKEVINTEVTPTGTITNPLPETVKPKDPPTKELECYFRNARTAEVNSSGYRTGVGRDITIELNEKYELSGSSIPPTGSSEPLDLNQKFVDDIQGLIDFLATPDGQRWGAKFIGYTSGSAPSNYNKLLSIDRATSVFKYVTEKVKTKGQSGGSGFTYNQENFSVSSVGYKCTSSSDKCAKTKDAKDLSFTDVPAPNANVYDSRWVIWGKGEDWAESPNDEDLVFGNNDLNSEDAKKDRKVKIVLFEIVTIDFTPPSIDDNITFEPPVEPEPTSDLNTPLTKSQYDLLKNQQTGLNLLQTTEAEQKAQNEFNKNTIGNKGGDTTINDNVDEVKLQKETINRTVNALFSECTYFEKIKKEDPFVYASLTDKIKNFHPAFHSITPEGFNERLTFLNQCTRQGPSVKPKEVATQNLAFGRPPICVLRIGDFYYTKIVIDSLGISYEPLVWDMNPEGVGVQPMIAKVDLSFSFIGGSSIDGPIRQLQNAVSFNFFANTSVFNPRRYYKIGDDENYETLVEKLKADANLQIKTNSDYIGYGSFGSQDQANVEINDITKVNTIADNQKQTQNVNQTSAPGAPFPQTVEQAAQSGFDLLSVPSNTNTAQAVTDSIIENGVFSQQEQEAIKNEYPAAEISEPAPTTKGFDKSKGLYKTQSTQILTFVKTSGKSSSTNEKLRIPKDTTIFLGTTTNNIYIGKVVNPSTPDKIFYNKVYLNCDSKYSDKPFTVETVPGLDGGSFSDKVLYDVIYPIFCKDNRNKTYAEIIA